MWFGFHLIYIIQHSLLKSFLISLFLPKKYNFFIHFLKFIKINLIGLNTSFLRSFTIYFNGAIITKFNNFFKNKRIFTFIFIKILLNVKIYNKNPRIMPKKIYNLNSPLLNLNNEYMIINPDKIQKIASSI